MTTKNNGKVKMGRPSMGLDARRVPVMVKASARERAEWVRRAKNEGMSLASWLAKPRRDELERGK